MVFACTSCTFQSNTRLLLIKHQFSCHSVEPSFRLTCGIRGCSHLFKFGSTISSFKTHASRKHTNWQENVEIEEPAMPSNTPSEYDSTATDDPLQDPLGSINSQTDLNDPVNDPANTQVVDTISSQKIAALFLLTFKEKFIIPQTALNFAIGSISSLIDCAREEGRDGIDPFECLRTEYMQTKFYREKFGLVVSKNNVSSMDYTA